MLWLAVTLSRQLVCSGVERYMGWYLYSKTDCMPRQAENEARTVQSRSGNGHGFSTGIV